MESSGKVQKITGNKLTLMMYKESSCAHCSGCGESIKKTKNVELDYNPEKFKIEVGDIVTLELSDSKMLKISFFVYVLPIFSMIAGYYLGIRLGKGEKLSALYSFGALIINFVIIYLYDKYIVKEKVNMSIVRVEKDQDELPIESCNTK